MTKQETPRPLPQSNADTPSRQEEAAVLMAVRGPRRQLSGSPVGTDRHPSSASAREGRPARRAGHGHATGSRSVSTEASSSISGASAALNGAPYGAFRWAWKASSSRYTSKIQ